MATLVPTLYVETFDGCSEAEGYLAGSHQVAPDLVGTFDEIRLAMCERFGLSVRVAGRLVRWAAGAPFGAEVHAGELVTVATLARWERGA